MSCIRLFELQLDGHPAGQTVPTTFEDSWNIIYKAHYCLTIDFQEDFSKKIIGVSASLFRLAEDGQQVLKLLKQYNEDTSITVLAVINIITQHLMHYLVFCLA